MAPKNREILNWIKMLRSHDEIGVILRGHLILESMLDDLIQYDFIKPKKIIGKDNGKLFTFQHKLLIASGRQLIKNKNARRAIWILNGIRNDLAHDSSMSLEQVSDISTFLKINLSSQEINDEFADDMLKRIKSAEASFASIKKQLLRVIALLSKDRERVVLAKINQSSIESLNKTRQKQTKLYRSSKKK